MWPKVKSWNQIKNIGVLKISFFVNIQWNIFVNNIDKFFYTTFNEGFTLNLLLTNKSIVANAQIIIKKPVKVQNIILYSLLILEWYLDIFSWTKVNFIHWSKG